MSLIPVDAEYHYVQDTAPSSANAGDVWLDTSVNPPVAKIYADVGGGLEWLVDQSSDRIATNLDAKVSNAGQGVDWASKTPKSGSGFVTSGDSAGATIISVSGSGYVTGWNVSADNDDTIFLEIDGTRVLEDDMEGLGSVVTSTEPNHGSATYTTLYRFGSSMSFGTTDSPSGTINGGVAYVLD